MLKHGLSLASALFLLLFLGSCKECKEPICFDVPGTYAFDNVNYSGQTQRLNMLAEMTTYMKTANVVGVALDANKLKEMYVNEGGHFSFTSTKQLKDKTFLLEQEVFESYMDAIAAASQATVAGGPGVAGVVESNDGSKAYLFDEFGIEYTQIIEKGLMGAVFYYQATAVYLGEDRIGSAVDNENVTPGEGTDMEHHWDEAFGYLGVPIGYPADKSGIRFHGKYLDDRDQVAGLDLAQPIMDAFILGRAAISNDDMDVKAEQVPIIRRVWEQAVAATAIYYINGGRRDFADDALRNHQLSEAIAFIRCLKYNPEKAIADTQIQAALDAIGTDLYNTTLSGLQEARDILAVAYGWENIADQF